jgi:hypothetical protein
LVTFRAGFAWPVGTAGKGITMEQTSEGRLREALERLLDTLDGLRNGTLTKLEADEIQAAIEEALRVQRFSANR